MPASKGDDAPFVARPSLSQAPVGAVMRQIDLICGGILAKIRATPAVQNGGSARPPSES